MQTRKLGAGLAASAFALLLAAPAAFAQPAPLTLTLEDYAEAPITGDWAQISAVGQAARLNMAKVEPGQRRLFLNDQTGVLYVLDKATRRPAPYLNVREAFPRLVPDGSYASGFYGFAFDPDYARNGVFYTVHLEDIRSTAAASTLPGYAPTPAVQTPNGGQPLTREAVLVEWTDSNVRDARFTGSAREVLRVALANGVHPMGEIGFNPAAHRGDADWRTLYIGIGDSGTGETNDVRRLNPQRLDVFGGKILRIRPDLKETAGAARVSENGRYRIPDDNPFVAIAGARPEIWAYGMRNPHRIAWDVDPAKPREAKLLAFVIGSNAGTPRFETIDVIRRGANYGYPLREGAEAKPANAIVGEIAADGTVPQRVSDTGVTGARVKLESAALQYKTTVDGDAIAGGFVYRGRMLPALRGKLVFGDITTGRIWYAEPSQLYAADDGDPSTMAPIHQLTTDLPAQVRAKHRARGGPATGPTGAAPASGRGRIDLRLAEDADGEILLLTKPDGMVRRVTGAR